jgi:mRNA-degrading endonuclease YafQ of YafQ-DinJ toxin-antitoxin module
MPLKISFDIMIPDHCELDEVMVYKYKDQDKTVMFADNVEEFSDSDSHDEDYMPAIDEEDEVCAYEETPLSDKEKAELQEELEKLIQDQELEVQWQEYKKD